MSAAELSVDSWGDQARGREAADATTKRHRGGCDRVVAPAATLARLRPLLPAMGITRVANVTGLDRVGIPTVAVYRPNGRSLSVAQGKGVTLVEAQVSGLMEAIELHHAERVVGPLTLCSHRELRGTPVADVTGLPRVATSAFHRDAPLLWCPGVDLTTSEATWVPYELVHTDFRLPFPTGSGAFFMSSNGLASGNHLLEALSHAICELVERDANTLFHLAGPQSADDRRVEPDTVDDPSCREALERFARADLMVGIWETTSDVGLPSFLCTVVDRDEHVPRPMPPVSGSGCHPRRRIALLRALTEAAQGRLTIIAGARDDLSARPFDARDARMRAARERTRLSESRDRKGGSQAGGALGPLRSFLAAPDVDHASVEADVRFARQRLAGAGLRQVIVVNLTDPQIEIPVVRVVVPHLEAMSEVPGYVPGGRGRRAMQEGRWWT